MDLRHDYTPDSILVPNHDVFMDTARSYSLPLCVYSLSQWASHNNWVYLQQKILTHENASKYTSPNIESNR